MAANGCGSYLATVEKVNKRLLIPALIACFFTISSFAQDHDHSSHGLPSPVEKAGTSLDEAATVDKAETASFETSHSMHGMYRLYPMARPSRMQS